VERALTAAIAHAKEAKTLKDACTGLNELAEKISAFHAVVPPAGFEQAFNGARNGIDMKIDVIQEQRCSEDSGLDADTIHSELDGLHERFVELQGIGAKP
jgi:hypothetical protein